MKYYQKKIFQIPLTWKTILMQTTGMQKEFKIANLGKYHDLYVQSNTLQSCHWT